MKVRAGEGGRRVETGAQRGVQLGHVERRGLLVFVAVVRIRLDRLEYIGHVAGHVSSVHCVLVFELLDGLVYGLEVCGSVQQVFVRYLHRLDQFLGVFSAGLVMGPEVALELLELGLERLDLVLKQDGSTQEVLVPNLRVVLGADWHVFQIETNVQVAELLDCARFDLAGLVDVSLQLDLRLSQPLLGAIDVVEVAHKQLVVERGVQFLGLFNLLHVFFEVLKTVDQELRHELVFGQI